MNISPKIDVNNMKVLDRAIIEKFINLYNKSFDKDESIESYVEKVDKEFNLKPWQRRQIPRHSLSFTFGIACNVCDECEYFYCCDHFKDNEKPNFTRSIYLAKEDSTKRLPTHISLFGGNPVRINFKVQNLIEAFNYFIMN